MGPKRNIYAIYTSQDKELAHNLLRRLQLLEKDYNVSIWHDDPIYPEQQWKPKKESQFNQANIVLLLVSNTFMHSQFVRQIEFKNIIDKYKEGKSTVIPILLDNCPWHIDFNSDDYNFSFKELQVLPEDRKPIDDWSSVDEALTHVTHHLKQVIAPAIENDDAELPNENDEEKAAKALREEQIAINFAEESEAKKRVEEENILKEETEVKRIALEAKRLKEEGEDKKRAEQELKLKEEAEVKRKALEEKRGREDAEAKRMANQEIALKEAEAQKRVEEENKLREEVEAKRIALKEKRLKIEAEAKRRAEHEHKRREEAEAKKSLEGNREEHVEKVIESREKREETRDKIEESEKSNTKNSVFIGLGVVALAILGIWVFSLFNSGSEKTAPTAPEINTTTIEDATATEKPKVEIAEPADKEVSFSELGVGDTYGGGLVFSVDQSGTSGKIAYTEDAGPMSWANAMNIHEQLGEGWRLPTLEELQLMYRTIGQGATNSGEFTDELYWSATPYDANQARLLKFRNGNASYHYNKVAEHRKFYVRAVRDF